MLDPKLFRDELDFVTKELKKRNFDLDTNKIADLEGQRKEIQVKAQNLQERRNSLSKEIGHKKSKGEDADPLLQEVNNVNNELESLQEKLSNIQKELKDYYLIMPNLLHDSVPIGNSEDDNVEVSKWGDVPNFKFTPKEHHELFLESNLMDFQTAAKLTGSRFVVLHSQLAALHRALINFMLDVHKNEHGYTEMYVPYIVNKETLIGSGQLPKFKEDLFKLDHENDYYLIPTAEVPVVNLVRGDIIDLEKLPIKFVCHTPCFRSEAGSYGKDTHGMIRQHQFEKVELVWIAEPDKSFDALEQIRGNAEAILQKLKLSYRVVALCSGDIGFCASKTYDLEVWLPGQNAYREISSCSNCEDFQARRMKTRYRMNPKKNELVHTLNGSGLAVGRTMVAVIENYQQENGDIEIPEVLQPYMNGMTSIQNKV